MGRTPLPLRILVHPTWVSHPSLAALADQGHTIEAFDATEADLLLHPQAHRWTDEFWDEPAYLAAALKRARMAKRAAK